MKFEKVAIRKDDKVKVITGKDKGKIGKVLKVLRKKDREPAVRSDVGAISGHCPPHGGVRDRQVAPVLSAGPEADDFACARLHRAVHGETRHPVGEYLHPNFAPEGACLNGEDRRAFVPPRHYAGGVHGSHPVIVSGRLRDELLKATDEDDGLRGILRRHADELQGLPAGNFSALDVNTPEEYQAALKQFGLASQAG